MNGLGGDTNAGDNGNRSGLRTGFEGLGIGNTLGSGAQGVNGNTLDQGRGQGLQGSNDNSQTYKKA